MKSFLTLVFIVLVCNNYLFADYYITKANSTNYYIPDNTGNWVSSEVVINGAPSNDIITMVAVQFDIIHPCSNNLDVWLTLWDGSKWIDYYFTNYSTSCTAVNMHVTMSFINYKWSGLPANQTWYLSAMDRVTGNVGYISYFEVQEYYASQPDISIINPTVTQSNVLQGGTIDVSCTQKINLGTTTEFMYYSYVGYYLSSSSNGNTNDILLGEDMSGLGGLNSEEFEYATLTIPPNISPGNYYIRFVGDDGNGISESNESNNSESIPITVANPPPGQPNLRYGLNQNILNISGTSINFSMRLINNGNAPAIGIYIAYYLSLNPTISTSDYKIGENFVSNLAANSYIDKSFLVNVSTLSPNIPPGTYYIGYIIDYPNSVSESNENDNVYCDTFKQLTVPTLSVKPPNIIVASTSGATGNFYVTANTSWTILNNASWLHLSQESGSMSGPIIVTATSSNTSNNPRSTNLTFSASGVNSVVAIVTQNGTGTSNSPPNKPLLLNPPDGNSYSSPFTFSWLGTDPDNDNLNYTIKARKKGTSTWISHSTGTQTSYESGVWTASDLGTYEWCVDAFDGTLTTTSDIREFSLIAPNLPPNKPSLLNPPDGNSYSSPFTLSWQCTDPDNDNLNYTIKARIKGTSIWSKLEVFTATSYYLSGWTSSDLNTYEWCVDATDGEATTTSDVREFTLITPNLPPNQPALLSPPDGNSYSSPFTFSWQGTDPDNDNLNYTIKARKKGTSTWISHSTGTQTSYESGVWTASDLGTYEWCVDAFDGTLTTTSDIREFTLLAQTPLAPTILFFIQPTCNVSKGSVSLGGLPASGTWTLTRHPSGYTNIGNGTSIVLSDLAQGSYTFTVTNSQGFTSAASANVTINQQPVTPTAPVIGNVFHPTCIEPNGSFTIISPVGTDITYTINGSDYYSWPGFGQIGSNTYTVYAKSTEGCISPGTNVTLNPQPPTPYSTIASLIQPSCLVSTGAVTLSSTGGSGMTYEIDGNASDFSNTTGIFTEINPGLHYFLTKNSDGCISSVPVFVTIDPQPMTPGKPTISQIDDYLTSSPGYRYQWYNASGLIPDAIEKDYKPISAGIYYVIVTNEEGCSSDPSDIYTLTGTEKQDVFKGISVYPNPAHNNLVIENDNSFGPINYEVINSSGKKIYNSILNKRSVIDLTPISSGVYLIKFIEGKNFFVLKFIKE